MAYSLSINKTRTILRQQGGDLVKLASQRLQPPGRRPYWVRMYRAELPGHEPAIIDQHLARLLGSSMVGDTVRNHLFLPTTP